MIDECVDHGCKGYGLGYATAWIRLPDGRKVSTTKHRKIYYEFTGELPQVVRHKCDNPRCININHLEGDTYEDNMADMYERNRAGDCRNFGAANGRTKLNPCDVAAIRKSYISGSRTHGLNALAKQFSISTSQVHRIVKRVHHVT